MVTQIDVCGGHDHTPLNVREPQTLSSQVSLDDFDRSKLRQGHDCCAHDFMKCSAPLGRNLNQRNIESFFEHGLNHYFVS
jgi:hypothetical protein